MTTDSFMLVRNMPVVNEALRSSVTKGPRSDEHFFNNQVGTGSSSELLHGALEISFTTSSTETVVNGCKALKKLFLEFRIQPSSYNFSSRWGGLH